jgi:hypothetical protein
MAASSTFNSSYLPVHPFHSTCSTQSIQNSDSIDSQPIPIALGKNYQKRMSVYQPMSRYNRFCGSTLSTAELDINDIAVRYDCSSISYIEEKVKVTR